MDLNPFINLVLWPIVSTVATGAAGAAVTYASYRFSRWSGINIEAKHREALHSAIRSGIGLAVAKGQSIGKVPTVNVGNPLVEIALQYVLRSVPDAIAKFDLSPATIEQMILAKLPQVAADTQVTAGQGQAKPGLF